MAEYPYNIESPQKLYIQWSADIVWNFNNGYPTGEESLFNWSSTFSPIDYNSGNINHVWMRYKVGEEGLWSLPMRINYPTIVEGAKGDKGSKGDAGVGIQGIRGKNIEIQFSNVSKVPVPYNSAFIEYIRFRQEGQGFSSWIRIKGIDGSSTGGVGVPPGGTNGQILSILSNSLVWIDSDDVYSNSDAVLAMGVLDDMNPLNHNRYTDLEAVSAMGIKDNNNPLNHDRYTDLEASIVALASFSATSPISILFGNISHLDTNGNRHIPTGGSNGNVLSTNGSGVYGWISCLLSSQIDDTAGIGDTDKVYSADKVLELIGLISTYGIQFSWADSTERAAQVGMIEGDLGLQRDTREIYRYDSTNWQFFFELDSLHNHDDRYYTKAQLNTSGAGGQVHWDNIIDTPDISDVWTKTGSTLTPTDSLVSNTTISIGGNNDVEQWLFQTNSSASSRTAAWRAFFNTGTGMKEFRLGLIHSSTEDYASLMTNYSDIYLGSTIGNIRFVYGGSIDSPEVSDSYIGSGGFNIGTTGEKAVKTNTNGFLVGENVNTAFNKAFGTTAGTVAEGNHTHVGLSIYGGMLNNSDDIDYIKSNVSMPFIIYSIIYDIGYIPIKFPPDDVLLTYGDSGNYFDQGEALMLKVSPLGDYDTLQEIYNKLGRLAYRSCIENVWGEWISHWASNNALLVSPVSRDRLSTVSPYKLSKHEGWITATLNTGWTGTFKYRKLTTGQIEIRCDLLGSSIAGPPLNSALTLEYRPGYNLEVSAVCNASYRGGFISINTVGSVDCGARNNSGALRRDTVVKATFTYSTD